MARIDIPLALRWNDIDGYGHVNNAAMLILLEEARIAAFWNLDVAPEHRRPTQIMAAGTEAHSHTLIASHQIAYLRPLAYTQRPVPTQLWVSRIGGASLDVNYEVSDPDGQVCVRATSILVMVDATSGRPRRLTPGERELMAEYMDEPLQLRR